MTEIMPESRFEFKNDSKELNNQLENLLSTELTPETINSYVDVAINGLISLSDEVQNKYKQNNLMRDSSLSSKEIEDQAFNYFGLKGINEILRELISINDQIYSIDNVIADAKKTRLVIIPTDEQSIVHGDGTLEKPERQNRLKTVLFLLQQDFEIDIHDKRQLEIIAGSVDQNMMRQISYYLINVPKLKRSLLVCDEKENASYAFDQGRMLDLNIDGQQLINHTKSELNDLIDENNGLGIKIIYSKNYINNIRNCIKDDLTRVIIDDEKNDPDQNKYLQKLNREKAPDGYLSLSGISRELGLAASTIEQNIIALDDELAEVKEYNFNNKIAKGYSEEQQGMILDYLEQRGYFNKPPEGYLSLRGAAQEVGASVRLIQKAIKELGDELGEIKEYNFGTRIIKGYSEDQQEMIRDYLEQQGYFNKPPEGHLNLYGMTQKFGLGHLTIEQTIKELCDELGEIKEYSFESGIVKGYSEEQQEKISSWLESHGYFNKPPEGYLSLYSIAQKFGVGPVTTQQAIMMLGDILGEVKEYNFNNTVTKGYSEYQQEMISSQLERQGYFTKPPEGYLSLKGMVQEFGLESKTIKKAIEEIRSKLGEVKEYSFRGKIVQGYSEDQQEMIRRKIIETNRYEKVKERLFKLAIK